MTDKWTWSGAAGVDAAGTTLLPTTILGAASITKTFVAAEVALLAKAERIDLDVPLSQYLRHRLTQNNATVRQHLAMRSGVQDFLEADYARLDKAIAAAPGRHWTGEQSLAFDTAAVLPPDSPYSYSNPSYLLLGLLIEKVTGQPLATVLRRDLVKPAGLGRAAFQDGEKPPAPVAGGRDPVCGLAAAFGHDGQLPDHTSMLVAVPERRFSVAVMVAEGNKRADQLAGEVISAAVPLLGG